MDESRKTNSRLAALGIVVATGLVVAIGTVWNLDRTWRSSMDARVNRVEERLEVKPAEVLAEVIELRDEVTQLRALLEREKEPASPDK